MTLHTSRKMAGLIAGTREYFRLVVVYAKVVFSIK